MRSSENRSWEVRLGIPLELNFALAVREVFALAVPDVADLIAAPLDDGFAFAPGPGNPDRALLGQQWSLWWAAMAVNRAGQSTRSMVPPIDPPRFESLVASPELREACVQVFPQFQTEWGGLDGSKQRAADVRGVTCGRL